MDGCSFLNVDKLMNAFVFKKKLFSLWEAFYHFSETINMYVMC